MGKKAGNQADGREPVSTMEINQATIGQLKTEQQNDAIDLDRHVREHLAKMDAGTRAALAPFLEEPPADA